MPRASNTRLVSHIDCPGGGQVWWDRDVLYVSHMRPPDGTSIYDVADPRHPKLIARLDVPMGWHSHKVRVANGIMIVNHERFGQGTRGRGWYSFTHKGVHFVGLNNVLQIDAMGKLGPDQLAWLKDDLAVHPAQHVQALAEQGAT